MIHAIGDSHSYFFTGTNVVRGKTWWQMKPDDRIPGYKSYNIGPATAYKFKDKHLDAVRQIIVDAQIPAEEPILLVFGEIDCRLHIGKQAVEEQKVHAWAVVDDAMTRYIEGVNELSKTHRVILWCVPPPSRMANEKDPHVFGNHTFRFNVTRIWNQALLERAEANMIPCASIFWDIAKDDVYKKKPMHYHCDDIHLSQAAMPYARDELYRWEQL